MSNDLSFCTDCGAQNKADNEFCIGCGVRLKPSLVTQVKELPAEYKGATMPDNNSKDASKISGIASQKNILVLVFAVLVSFVAGAGLALENAFSGIVGNRTTEKQLENEKEQSYEIGYNSGYEDGSSDGYSRGYTRGEIDGCNAVFDKVGANQLIAIFYPYTAFSLGKYYSTRESTC